MGGPNGGPGIPIKGGCQAGGKNPLSICNAIAGGIGGTNGIPLGGRPAIIASSP